MNKKVVIGLIIAFIMVSSIFGFVADYASRSVSKIKYGDFKFKIVNQQYITKINGKEHTFVFFPRDLEYMTISEDVKKLLAAPVLTVTYDPKSSLAEKEAEAQYYFETQLDGEKVIERALTNNEGTELPQKSCADATPSQPVIELRKGDAFGIKAEGNCIMVMSADALELYQETERIIYMVLGVMQ